MRSMIKIRFTAYILAFACMMIFTTNSLLAAEITAKDMVTYTRIIPKNSGNFTISQGEKSVVITFDKADKINTSALKSSLGSTVRDVKISANGRVVTFLLKDSYHVRQFEGSAGKGFDILKTKIVPKENKSKIKSITSRPDKTSKNAPLPATIEKTDEIKIVEEKKPEPSVIPVAFIEDKNGMRIVLNVPDGLDITANESVEGVNLKPSKNVTISDTKLPDYASDYIKSLSFENNTLSLIKQADSSLKQYRNGENLILELKIPQPNNQNDKKLEEEPKASAEPQTQKAANDGHENRKEELITEESPASSEPEITAPAEQAGTPVLAEIPAVSQAQASPSPAVSAELITAANAHSFTFYHGGLISVISDKDFKSVNNPFEKAPISAELFMASAVSGWPVDSKIEKDKIQIFPSAPEQSNTPELQISIKPGEDGAKLYEIRLSKRPDVLAFKHPLTGELMFAARFKNGDILSNNNIINSVGFSIIPSKYAIVIAARNEDVTVTDTDYGIIIKEPAFLHAPKTPVAVEPPPEEEKKKSTEEQIAEEDEEVDPDDWNAVMKKFNRAIGHAKGEERTALELKFVDEMIRVSFFREAKSMLESIKSLPNEYVEKLVLLNIYSDRLPEAMDLLNSISAEKSGVGEMLKFLSGKADFPDTSGFINAISAFPDDFKVRLAKRVLDQIFVTNSPENAHKFLQVLSSSNITKHDPVYFDKVSSFIKSLIAKNNADFFTAEGIWSELSKDMDDVEFRIKSRLEIIIRRIETGEMPRPDAIAKLNAIRHLCGSRDFQMKILPLIAKLSMEERQYADALNTLRYIATYSTDSDEATKAAGELSETFIRLFNQGEANQLSPLDALSLYYEFRELTPAGEQGDEMIRNLADRLVSVELLDRAATLLNHQLKYRVEGEQKAKIGARLAVINIMNAQPSIAIDAIDYSEIQGIPPELIERRKLLKSQALLELGRYDEAISNIEELKSREARNLEAQILWKAKRWDDLISKFEPELNNREDPTKVLDQSEMRDLMRIVVSYVFKNDNKSLSRLNSQYNSLIPDENFKKQLEFLAGGTETIHQENLESLAKSISNFKTFMDSVKTEVSNKSLSEAIK